MHKSVSRLGCTKGERHSTNAFMGRPPSEQIGKEWRSGDGKTHTQQNGNSFFSGTTMGNLFANALDTRDRHSPTDSADGERREISHGIHDKKVVEVQVGMYREGV